MASNYIELPPKSGGGSGAVDSVNGLTGVVVLTKSTIGLGNVNNTSDATKNAAAVTLTNKRFVSPGGSVSAPTYAFAESGNDTGIYSTGDGNISFANNASLAVTISGNDLTVTGNIAAANYPPMANANTFAGFDGSGVLESIPGFNIKGDSGGIDEQITIQPDNVGGGNTLNNAGLNFDPLQNSPDDNWNLNNIFANFDVNSSGFSQGTSGQALTLNNLNVGHLGTGDIGSVAMTQNYFNLGNGTDPISVRGVAYSYGFGDINSGVTMTGAVQGYGFQPNVHTGAILDSNNDIRAFYDNTNISVEASGGYSSFTSSPVVESIADGKNFNGYGLSPNITTFTGSAGFTGFGVFPNIGTMTTGGFQGVQISPNISSAGSGFHVGLNINMNDVTGFTGQRPHAINTNSGRVHFNTPSSGQDGGFQVETSLESDDAVFGGVYGLNSLGGALHIVSGSPINDGSFGIGNNLGIGVLAEDDIGPDSSGFGLGFVMNGFLTQVAVKTGKTVDSLTFMGAGASAPPDSDGGTFDKVAMFRAIGVVPGGGSLLINEIYGFKVDNLLSSLSPAKSWGIYVDDSVADNYLAKSLAIGTTTKQVSSNDVALEIGTQKAIRLPRLTTTQRNALVPLESMLIYNTTTKATEYYDGTSWI